MTPEFQGAKLLIGPDMQIEFEHEIKKVLRIGDLIIVLLKIPSGVILNENVIGITGDGRVRWKIENIVQENIDSPYIDIEVTIHGLNAYNWSGIRVGVDIDSGRILNKRITK